VADVPSKRLRVVQIGCGAWGRNLVRELHGHPGVDLVLLIDPDPNALARSHDLAPDASTASSIDSIQDREVEACVIASPGPMHASHALAALRVGDVFLEKPMTTSVTDARMLVSACKAYGRVGMVGHLLHHHGAVQAMLAAVREGRIGAPLVFRSARLCVRGSRDVDGSMLWCLAPHDISVLRMLDTSSVQRMKVDLHCLGSCVGATGPNVADMRLRMASGLFAHVQVSRAHAHKVRRMEIAGELGTVVLDDMATTSKLTLHWKGRVEDLQFDPVPPLRAEVDAFVRCVRGCSVSRTDFSEGLAVVELLECAQRVACVTRESPADWAAW